MATEIFASSVATIYFSEGLKLFAGFCAAQNHFMSFCNGFSGIDLARFKMFVLSTIGSPKLSVSRMRVGWASSYMSADKSKTRRVSGLLAKAL